MTLNNQNNLSNFKLRTKLNECQRFINSINSTPNTFDKDSLVKINNLLSKVKEKIKNLKKELKDIGDILEKTEERKTQKELKSKVSNLKSRINDLKSAINELNRLKDSTTQYKIGIDKSAPRFDIDTNNDTGLIYYDGTEGSLLNELKHAFQFDTNKIDIIEINENGIINTTAGFTYDIIDEVETYKRQYAYDGVLKLTLEADVEKINNLPMVERIKNIEKLLDTKIEIKSMDKIRANVIVKISDGSLKNGLYKKISQRSLDINSKIKEIRKGNKNRKEIIDSLGINKFDKSKPYIEFIKVYINKKHCIYVK